MDRRNQAENAEGVSTTSYIVVLLARFSLRVLVAGARGSIRLAAHIDQVLADAFPTPLDLVHGGEIDGELNEPIAHYPPRFNADAEVANLGRQFANVAIHRPIVLRAPPPPAAPIAQFVPVNAAAQAPPAPHLDGILAAPAENVAPAAPAPAQIVDPAPAPAPAQMDAPAAPAQAAGHDAQDPPAYDVPNAAAVAAWHNDQNLGTRYYAVIVGRGVGVFRDWPTVHRLVNGVPGSTYRRYASEADATAAFNNAIFAGLVHRVEVRAPRFVQVSAPEHAIADGTQVEDQPVCSNVPEPSTEEVDDGPVLTSTRIPSPFSFQTFSSSDGSLDFTRGRYEGVDTQGASTSAHTLDAPPTPVIAPVDDDDDDDLYYDAEFDLLCSQVPDSMLRDDQEGPSN